MVRAQGVGGQGVKALGGKGLKDSTGADRAGEAGVPAGYKRTEVGVVPVEWEVVELSKLCEIRGRVGWKGYTKKDLVVRGAYAIGAMHITSENLLDLSNPTYLSRNKFEESPEIVVLKGDVLIVQRGSIGKVVLIDRHIGDATINPSVLILRSHSISSEFLYSFLASKQGQKCISDSITSTSVPMITQQQVGVFPIPLPPLPEQRVIAGALGEADALLAALDGLIAKKAAVKQATLEELLSGRRRLGGDNPGARQILKLGELGQTYGGLTGKTKGDFGTGNKRYVTFMNVIYNTVVDSNLLDRVYVTDKEKQNEVRKGDLLFNTSSETPEEVGMCAYVGADLEGVYLNSFCFGFKLSGADVDALYLAYLVNSPIGREKFAEQAQGATRYNLSKYNFRSIEFGFPSIKEQRAIATLLTTLDDELTALRARREKLAAVKSGMMEQLLTGAVRLV